MRLFTATLATETNTFSPLPTSLENYRESVFFRPGEHPTDAPRMCTAPLFVGRARAKAEGFELIEGSCFAASPAGTTNRADYEFMRDEILGQLKAALPVDGLLLGLHGAMVAHGYDDVEGDILERARAIVGPKCVIGVELDPHCHLTMKRVSKADIIVLYKEFPHTDVVERAEDVLDLVLTTLRGKIKPVMSVYDCRQIQSYPTTLPADARAGRPHHGDGGQGRHPVGLDRPLLPLRRRRRDRHARAGDRRRRQEEGRRARDQRWARSWCRCAARPRRSISTSRAGSARASPSTTCRW